MNFLEKQLLKWKFRVGVGVTHRVGSHVSRLVVEQHSREFVHFDDHTHAKWKDLSGPCFRRVAVSHHASLDTSRVKCDEWV